MKKPIHHFLPHLFAGLGAAFIVFVITLSFDVSHSPTGQAQNITPPPGCSFAAANYDNDLFVSTYDRAQYITYANQCDSTGQNCSKAILRTGATTRVPAQDDACMSGWMSYEQSLGNSIVIASPVNTGGTQEISGLSTFKLQSNIFANSAVSLSGLQFYSELQSGAPAGTPVNYSRTLVGSMFRRSIADPHIVEVDIDTLAFYSGMYRFTFCPITNSPNADHDFCTTAFTTPYTITNTGPSAITFTDTSHLPNYLEYNAYNLAQVSQVNVDLYNGTAAVGNPVQRAHFSWTATADNHLRFVVPAPSTDGVYTARMYYTALWGNLYPVGALPPHYQDFIFTLQHTTTPSGSGDTNTNTSTTGDSGNTNSGAINTNTVANVNTSTATSATVTLNTPPQGASLFFLPQINGTVSAGQSVDLTLKIGSTSSSTVLWHKQVPTNSNKTFTYVLAEPLAPGSYVLQAKAIVDTTAGPILTRTFTILPPNITLQAPQTTSTSSIRTLTMVVHGQLSQIQLFAAHGSLPPIYIGQAQPITGNTEQWSMSFDTTTLEAGSYTVYATGTGVGGLQFRSTNGFSLDVKSATTKSGDSGSAPTTTTTITTTPSSGDSNSGGSTTTPSSEKPNTVVPVTTPSSTTTSVKPSTDPRYDGVVKAEKLQVHQPSNASSSTPTKPALTFSGVGPANSIVTLFIYSDPIVVTTRTDANGNWSYTLDQNIGDGQHQVFVTLTDSTGKVAEKSNPLNFFVNQAKAVSQQDFVAASTPTTGAGNQYLTLYIIIASLIVLFAICVILFFRFGRPVRPHYA